MLQNFNSQSVLTTGVFQSLSREVILSYLTRGPFQSNCLTTSGVLLMIEAEKVWWALVSRTAYTHVFTPSRLPLESRTLKWRNHAGDGKEGRRFSDWFSVLRGILKNASNSRHDNNVWLSSHLDNRRVSLRNLSGRRQTSVLEHQPDEYKMKGVEEVKYMRGEENRVNARNQENLEKSNVQYRGKPQKEVSAANIKSNIHTSESQQEFFRMLDEKIEKGRDYCSEGEEEDGT
ncbi:Uncharacterized protein E3U43_006835 [Larimichthys crocea]|uniref:Uncharacterized protein n=1 Tax=Larimichthys crocea TaxID=215358 RepID=A0ACD3RLW5_LARCR|nr:Uncharacterized protein E3U43_006835 [Larimichthys crocea]